MAEQEDKRKLDAARRQAQEQVQEMVKKKAQEAVKKAAKKAASKVTVRLISGAAAASIVGLIITYLIMSIQMFAGNLLGAKIVPKLSLIELLIWGMVSLILFAATVAIIFILHLLSDPWQGAIIALNLAEEWLKKLWPI
jgi:hypothetical protein